MSLLRKRPEGGQAVRLTAEWPWAGSLIKVGAIGVINGFVGYPAEGGLHICWDHSTFRGWGGYGCPEHDFRSPRLLEYYEQHPSAISVSSSGGPATIMLPPKLLRPTKEIVSVKFWCWKDFPKAGGGYHYVLDVPLWEWDGKGYS